MFACNVLLVTMVEDRHFEKKVKMRVPPTPGMSLWLSLGNKAPLVVGVSDILWDEASGMTTLVLSDLWNSDEDHILQSFIDDPSWTEM